MGYIMPAIMALTVLYGLIKKVDIFTAFSIGAKEGMKTLYSIAPSMIGLIVSVSMLKASGALDKLCELLSPVAEFLHFPVELLPMTLLRPVSGSGSTALLNQVLKDYGPDSFLGRCASCIAGSTETTFYAITVYFGAVNIKKIRHTLFAALAADLTAAVVSVITVRLLL